MKETRRTGTPHRIPINGMLVFAESYLLSIKYPDLDQAAKKYLASTNPDQQRLGNWLNDFLQRAEKMSVKVSCSFCHQKARRIVFYGKLGERFGDAPFELWCRECWKNYDGQTAGWTRCYIIAPSALNEIDSLQERKYVAQALRFCYGFDPSRAPNNPQGVYNLVFADELTG